MCSLSPGKLGDALQLMMLGEKSEEGQSVGELIQLWFDIICCVYLL